MSDYDAVSCFKEVVAIGNVVLGADNTPAAIDTINWRGAAVLTNVGVGGITFSGTDKIEFKLYHGETTTFGESTAVEDTDVIMPFGETLGSGGIIRSLIAAKAAADVKAHQVGYIGKKRYLFLLADFSGTHGTGTPITATVRFTHPLHAPGDQGNYDDSHAETF